MKKRILLFVSILSFSLAFNSCSKDDDSGASTSGNIVGKWIFLKQGEIVGGEEVLYPYENSCSSENDFTELYSNGTLRDVYYNSSCSESIDNATWSRSGNMITVSYGPGDSSTSEIIELTSTKLKVKYYDEVDEIYYLTEFVRN